MKTRLGPEIVRRAVFYAASVVLCFTARVDGASKAPSPAEGAREGAVVTVEKLNVPVDVIVIRLLLLMWNRIEGDDHGGAYHRWVSAFAAQLSDEVNEERFRRLVQQSLRKCDDPTRGLRFRVTENASALQVSGTTVSEDVTTAVVARVKRYVEQRLELHSREYGEASLAAAGAPVPDDLSPFARAVLDRYPGIPLAWLRPIPEWAVDVDSECPDRERLIVIDGPVAWEYSGDPPFEDVRRIRRDAMEFDAEKGPIIRRLTKQIADELGRRRNEALIRFGGAVMLYAELGRRLEEQYGLKWLSPLLLTPELQL